MDEETKELVSKLQEKGFKDGWQAALMEINAAFEHYLRPLIDRPTEAWNVDTVAKAFLNEIKHMEDKHPNE